MKNKTKLIITIVVLAAAIAVAAILYNTLTDKYQPQNALNAPAAPTQSAVTPDASASASQPPAEAQSEAPMAAPDVKLYDGDGNSFLLSDYAGKPMVVNFWASWCGYCKVEMPYFEAAYQQYGEDVTFLMVDMVDGVKETVDKGKAFIETTEYTFPVAFDSDGEASYYYSVRALPSTVFIDKDGNIAAAVAGPLDTETLNKGIDLILGNTEQ